MDNNIISEKEKKDEEEKAPSKQELSKQKKEEAKQKKVDEKLAKKYQKANSKNDKKQIKAKKGLLKLFKKSKIKSKALNKKLSEYVDVIDVERMASEVFSLGNTYSKAFQTIILEGYDYECDSPVFNLDGKSFISENYNKTALIFLDTKMYIYSYTFSLKTDYSKIVSSEIYYNGISSISLINDKCFKNTMNNKSVLIHKNCLEISSGINNIIPLENVVNFSDKPVLKEMIDFIDSKRN